jgi:predicted 3-demethylubiquinone-9 3-methyltransferase (glyoxalase superfamily)
MATTGLTTFLWFEHNALEAATLYTTLFNGALGDISYYPADAQLPADSVLTVSFTLFDRPFVALNGGPGHPHSEAVSFQVACETQEDVDRVWDVLIADGGAPGRCGWCTDRFGLAWQVIPHALGAALGDANPERARHAFQAMMQMSKIVVADLQP